jgi:hypothetical protein
MWFVMLDSPPINPVINLCVCGVCVCVCVVWCGVVWCVVWCGVVCDVVCDVVCVCAIKIYAYKRNNNKIRSEENWTVKINKLKAKNRGMKREMICSNFHIKN